MVKSVPNQAAAPASPRPARSHLALPVQLISNLLCLSFLLPATLDAKTKASTLDRDYVSALAAANNFLYAWLTQDRETGLLMLTDAAKRHSSEDHLQTFLSPDVASEHAYEIGRGKKLSAGRYAFPVALFERAPGKSGKGIHPRLSQIIVIRTGHNDWAIDKLP
jgi:hypothetical protein